MTLLNTGIMESTNLLRNLTLNYIADQDNRTREHQKHIELVNVCMYSYSIVTTKYLEKEPAMYVTTNHNQLHTYIPSKK